MRQLFGQLTIGCWKLPKPSAVTSKVLKMEKEDHEPIPKARVGVSPGLILGTGLGLTPGCGPGPALEVNLGIGQGPTAKAATLVTHGAYVPGPQMDPHPEGE